MSSTSGLSRLFDLVIYSDLELSSVREIRYLTKGEVGSHREIIGDPNYSSSLTRCSEDYNTKDMSSEDTVSIEGEEEVMSSSKESETGTLKSGGSEESRGQEGSAVSTNILKVDDSRERCYDKKEEMVEEALGYKSCWRTRGELGYLVENYNIPPHVLVRPTGSEDVEGLRAWINVACVECNSIGGGVFNLLPKSRCNYPYCGFAQVLLYSIGREWKEKGWFYFTPRVAEGRSRNLFTAGPSSIKGWKDKFFFVDNTEWGKRDGEVKDLSRWKGKKLNPKKYLFGEGEKNEVERLERDEGELVNIMYLTNLEVVEAIRIYEKSSLREDVGGKVVRLPKKKSKTLAPTTIEERVGVGLQDPTKVEDLKLRWGLARSKGGGRLRKKQQPKKGKGWKKCKSHNLRPQSSLHPNLPYVDQAILAGSGGCNTWEGEKLYSFSKANVELFRVRQDRCQAVKEELATTKKAIELKEQKRKNCKETLAKKDNELADVKKKTVLAIHNSVEQHVFDFIKSPTFSEVEDILPLKLEYEFVVVDEEEVKVPKEVEVADNVQNEKVDQQHKVTN
ncbi:hypothetical protein SLEP1_g18216 [Rubroshorea leprosula]|uniref:Transposase n=1 Tax=Rubroshorea leprosula TaxID=152421 RepID=A0AAV5J5P7_9ROSI|nr:hypothetical protein SLEP1_g18216 [Rubroshorea leprosula]